MSNIGTPIFDIEQLLDESELQQNSFTCFFRDCESGFEQNKGNGAFLGGNFYDVTAIFSETSQNIALVKNDKVVGMLSCDYNQQPIPSPQQKAKTINDFVNSCFKSNIN